MKVAYATATSSVTMPGGNSVLVQFGTHWPADDPFVRSHPDLFSEDPRYGMQWTVEPELVETATANPGERRTAKRNY